MKRIKLSHLVILICAIGIAILLILERNTSTQLQETSVKPDKSQMSPTPIIPVECASDYLNLTVNSKWRYEIKVASDSGTITSNLTTELIKKAPGILTFSQIDTKTKEAETVTMICTSEGIFGLPFSIASTEAIAEIIPIDGSEFLSIPTILDKNTQWTAPIFSLAGINIGIEFKVVKFAPDSVSIVGSIPQVSSILNGDASLAYSLKKDVGIDTFNAQLTLPDEGKIGIKGRLLKFTPVPATTTTPFQP